MLENDKKSTVKVPSHITPPLSRRRDFFIRGVDNISKDLAPYRKFILAALVVAIAGALGWGSYYWYQQGQEEKARDAYFNAQFLIEKRLEDLESAYQSQISSEKKKSGTAQKMPPRAKNLEQDLPTQLKTLEDVLAQFSSTKTSLVMALELSKIFNSYQSVDKALTAFEKVKYEPSAEDIVGAAFLLQHGDLLAQKQQCEKAIALWAPLVEIKAWPATRAEALLRQGLCYEQLNKKNLAKETYEKITIQFPQSRAAKEVKKILRHLETQG